MDGVLHTVVNWKPVEVSEFRSEYDNVVQGLLQGEQRRFVLTAME